MLKLEVFFILENIEVCKFIVIVNLWIPPHHHYYFHKFSWLSVTIQFHYHEFHLEAWVTVNHSLADYTTIDATPMDALQLLEIGDPDCWSSRIHLLNINREKKNIGSVGLFCYLFTIHCYSPITALSLKGRLNRCYALPQGNL